METKQFVNKYRAISNRINRLHDQRQQLVNQYYDENMPDWHGKVIKVVFKDGSYVKGVSVYEPELNRETGEFRPNLNRCVNGKPKNKRVYYDWKAKIDRIEIIRDVLTCKDCGWRVIKGDNMYCKLQVDTQAKSHVKVNADKPACEDICYVKWANGIPVKTYEICKEEHLL